MPDRSIDQSKQRLESSTSLTIQLLGQFGAPVRGISPYADSLLTALRARDGLQVKPVDYASPYPSFLHPGSTKPVAAGGEVHWAMPKSWYRVAHSQADLLHVQHWVSPMATFLAPLCKAARGCGKRVVVTIHNPTPHERLPFFGMLDSALVRNADAIVVHTEGGKRLLCQRYPTLRERIAVIPHGVQLVPLEQLHTAGDQHDDRLILTFGNLRGYKGIVELLHAWKQVTGRIPDVRLVIAGRFWDGKRSLPAAFAARALRTKDDATQVRQLLQRPEFTSRVTVLSGFQSDQKINQLLDSCEFSVFSYKRFNSQSGAACRAVGRGCPVLVSDTGGLPDLAIDRSWVVEPSNDGALAAAMERKLSGKRDRSDLRQRQWTKASQYRWDSVALAHEQLYRTLMRS